MEKVLMLRIGELHLKGRNRIYFEKKLLQNLKLALSEYVCNTSTICSRFFISNYQDDVENEIINVAKKVFGFVSLSICSKIKTEVNSINAFIKSINLNGKSFRVSVKRADKSFPIISTDYEKQLGEIVLENNPNSVVALKNYDVEVLVDIREDKNTYISFEKIACCGGMPVGTAGKTMLLLSGGIDSPVAGYLMAKRGCTVNALHFHSYPYTSELAKNKVIKLANELHSYTNGIKLFIVNFKNVQEEIHKNCKPEYMITIMRRIMMRIAQKLCETTKCLSITTGENLGQVASQTMEGLISTSEVVSQTLPIFRPLICYDKIEIMNLAEKIDTYNTSILPYEDCCTVFLPKNPLIKPELSLVHVEESKLNIEKLVDDAIENVEIIDC